jgi:hypothetical protein
MLTSYEKKALRRITAHYTDTQKDELGANDTMALHLIAEAKARELSKATLRIADLERDLAQWQLEKEIWENVQGVEILENNE